jgi:flagellin
MSLIVNTNIAAMDAYRNLSMSDSQQAKSLERLSSGFRINRAADDAAGLSISEGLRSQISGLQVAARNAQDGISVVQTAEGALNETQALLHRLRDLSVQASNTGANDSDARNAAAAEADQISQEVDRIAKTTKFGGTALLDGSADGNNGGTALTFQVGSDNTTGNSVSVNIADMSSTGLKLDSSNSTGTSVSDLIKAGSTDAIGVIDDALKSVSAQRADLGAVQNRFEHTIANLNVTSENLSASESRIRDTDMAQEMTNFTRAQILTQAGTGMLAQANSSSQAVLKLLQGQ